MECELSIQLIPTGDVVSVTLVRSSGNPAFDSSAVNAVQKAGAFPELQNLPSGEFEKNFRRLTLYIQTRGFALLMKRLMIALMSAMLAITAAGASAQLTIEISQGADNPTTIAVVPFGWQGAGARTGRYSVYRRW